MNHENKLSLPQLHRLGASRNPTAVTIAMSAPVAKASGVKRPISPRSRSASPEPKITVIVEYADIQSFFYFDSYHTISDLKMKVQESRGISTGDQTISKLTHEELEDSVKFVDLGVVDGFIILKLQVSEYAFTMFQLGGNGHPHFLEVESFNTVFDVKVQLGKVVEIYHERISMWYEGEELQNNRTLFSYRIHKDSQVDFKILDFDEIPAEQLFSLTVNFIGGGSTTLEVKAGETVRGIKEELYFKEGFPVADQTLWKDSIKLKDEMTLLDYQTPKVIYLDARFTLKYVKLSGETGSVVVAAPEQVYIVKSRIAEAEFVPMADIRLLFDGDQLSDNLTLADNGVKKGDTLELVLSEGTMSQWLRSRVVL